MRPCWTVYQLLLLFALEGKTNEDYFGNLGYSSDEAESHWAETNIQEFNPSTVLAFVPARSCHLQFSGDHGTFSPPIFYGNIEVNLWCNWTVRAAPGKHIVIYITGFKTNKTCSENHDEIIFEGVSSSVENTIVYACWNKHTHVFATQASAVSVVLLQRSFSNTGPKRYFVGRYYVFDDPVLGPNTVSGNCSLTSKPNISTSDVIQAPIPHKSPKAESKGYSVLPALSSSNIPYSPGVHHPQQPPTVMESYRPTATTDLLTVTTREDVLQVTRTLAQSLLTTYNPLMSQLPAVRQSLELGVFEGHTDLPTAGNLEPSQIVKWQTTSQSIWTWKTAHSEFLSETPSLTPARYTELLEASHLGATSNVPETQQFNKDQSTVVLTQSLITPITESTYVHRINATELQRNQHSTSQMSPYFSKGSTARTHETPQFSTAHKDTFQETSYLNEANVPKGQHLSRTDFPDQPGNQHLGTAHATDPPEASLIHILRTGFPEPSLLSDISYSNEIHTTKFTEISHLRVDHTIEQVNMPHFGIAAALEFSKTLNMPPNNGILGKTDNANSDDLESHTSQVAPSSTAPPILPSMIRTSDLGFQMEHSTPQRAVVTVDQQLMLDGSVASHPAPEIPTELIYSKSALQITDKRVTINENISRKSLPPMEVTKTLVEPAKELDWWTVKDNLEATDSISRISPHPRSTPMSSSGELFSSTFSNTSKGIEPHDTFTHSYRQPTDDSILNMDITTIEQINEGNERSTYSYQTNSDPGLQQNAAGQPRGSYLDEEDVTYFSGNLSDLEFAHEPGDSLFLITTEIEQQDVLRGFEKDLVKSVREKITERMVYFPSEVNSLILKEIRWKNVYRVTLTFWLHLIRGGKEMRNFLKTQLKTLEGYPLLPSNAKLVAFTVEDVNECQLGIHDCHGNAHCVNMVGSYSCYCMDGYKDHSSAAPGTVCISAKLAEVRFLSEHVEILIGAMVTAAVAVLLVVIIFCIVQQKRRAKVNFSPQDPATREHGPYALGGDHHGEVGLPLSLPSRHLLPQPDQEHHTAMETSSTLELTKVTIEQDAC